jgi:hypothetical protein
VTDWQMKKKLMQNRFCSSRMHYILGQFWMLQYTILQDGGSSPSVSFHVSPISVLRPKFSSNKLEVGIPFLTLFSYHFSLFSFLFFFVTFIIYFHFKFHFFIFFSLYLFFYRCMVYSWDFLFFIFVFLILSSFLFALIASIYFYVFFGFFFIFLTFPPIYWTLIKYIFIFMFYFLFLDSISYIWCSYGTHVRFYDVFGLLTLHQWYVPKCIPRCSCRTECSIMYL